MATTDQDDTIPDTTPEASVNLLSIGANEPLKQDSQGKILATLEPRPSKDCLSVKSGMKGKPKPLYFWSCADVNKWLRKHGGQLFEIYGEVFSTNEVTGRTLIRMTDIKLEKMGIREVSHRHDLMYLVLRLRLKHENPEIRNLNQRGSGFELKLPDTRVGQSSSMDKLTMPAPH